MWDNVDSLRTILHSGKGITSLNAHCGPVDFLISTSCTLASDVLRRDTIFNGGEEGTNGEERIGTGGDGETQRIKQTNSSQDSQAFLPKEETPKRLLLQYHLHSTYQLPGKLLTAQLDQSNQTSTTECLEHSPEDGSIYEVSEDPDVWVRGRPVEVGREGDARRSKVTSTAIFSGGRGHRRIGQTPSTDTCSDPSENTLLVWQLPLTVSQWEPLLLWWSLTAADLETFQRDSASHLNSKEARTCSNTYVYLL